MNNRTFAYTHRAMRAAGLDPTNRADLEKFTNLLREEVNRLDPEGQQAFLNGTSAAAQAAAAARYRHQAIEREMDTHNLHWDKDQGANRLFQLGMLDTYEHGLQADLERQERNEAAHPTSARNLWSAAKEGRPAPQSTQPPAAQQDTQTTADTGTPLPNDPNELWKMARSR